MNIVQHPSRPAVLLPVALLILGVAVLIARSPSVESRSAAAADDSPERCVARLLAAERQGDVREYLDCFSPPPRARLEAVWREQSHSRVADELRERATGLVGRAVTDLEFAGPDRAALILERISKDHSERRRVELRRDAGRWQIVELSPAEWQTPAIPYGTPVFTPR